MSMRGRQTRIGRSMPSIICRPSATKEEASKRTMQPDLDQQANEFYINSFVVMEDLITLE